MDATLAPTKEAIVKTAQEYQLDDVPLAMLASQAGHHYSFYNLSRHNLKTITNDPDTLSINLRDYINRFSANVRNIFEKYKFEDTVAELESHDLLFQVMQHFAKVNLRPNKVSNEQMGNIFEELIRKFAEASNETAGEHFTPHEVIELMVTLLLADDEDLRTDYIVREVYDPTAGTGGMLSVAEEKIKAINPNADVILLGQKRNPESYAICKADMVVKGQEVDSIVLGNTLTAPAFEGRTFHFGLSNPPFGVDWKTAKAFVEDEHKSMGFHGPTKYNWLKLYLSDPIRTVIFKNTQKIFSGIQKTQIIERNFSRFPPDYPIYAKVNFEKFKNTQLLTVSSENLHNYPTPNKQDGELPCR